MFLLGNWQVAGIYTYFPCAPLSFGNDIIFMAATSTTYASNPNGPTFDTSRFNLVSSQQLATTIGLFRRYTTTCASTA